MQSKLVGFVRHYNDLDHFLPVFDRWLETTGMPAAMVFTDKPVYLKDYRVGFLKRHPQFSADFIGRFLPPEMLSGTVVGQVTREVIGAAFDAVLADTEDAVVCNDWVMTTSGEHLRVARMIASEAKRRGLTTVALPHGDAPHANMLIFDNQLSPLAGDIYWPSVMFDHVVVPNELCAKRYRPHSVPERIQVLGSPRFNSAWLGKLNAIVPPLHHEEADGKTRVVVFLRPSQFIVNTGEVLNALRVMCRYSGVYLLVVNHTRKETSPLARFVKEERGRGSAIQVAPYGAPITALVNWAELVVDLATSVSFEAVKKDVPVLTLEYCHGNISTVATYMPHAAIRCRDDLCARFEEIAAQGVRPTYSQEERQRFIADMIDVPDADVLPRYVRFLQSCLKNSSQTWQGPDTAGRCLPDAQVRDTASAQMPPPMVRAPRAAPAPVDIPLPVDFNEALRGLWFGDLKYINETHYKSFPSFLNLAGLAYHAGCREILEIGSGVSTAVWSNYVVRTGAEVTTVDADLSSLRHYTESSALKEQILSTITFLEGTTLAPEELAHFFEGTIDGIPVGGSPDAFIANLKRFVRNNSPHQWEKMLRHFGGNAPDIAAHVLDGGAIRVSRELAQFVSTLRPFEGEHKLLRDARAAGRACILDKLIAAGKTWDLIFFDSGEWSSMPEWVKFRDRICVG
ncbi:MAG: hypothetical protein GF418_10625, partial [Chitinivibrionales bacterium]|nr:hypothetical protein [Chitinivibrionales bacterium]MBD3396068.1 hypothetical protein [Chitinivibrionales bacterium]